MPDVTAAEALDAIQQMPTWSQAMAKAETVLLALASQEQVSRELGAAIEQKRATLAEDCAKVKADAAAEASELRDQIVADAQQAATKICDEAQATLDATNNSVRQAQTELADLQQQAADLKSQLRALAGA
jgi:uncharacterized coiled-coil DUF342 family protein